MKTPTCLLVAAFLLSAIPLPAARVTAVSNLGQLFATTHTVGKSGASDFHQAASFTTGSAAEELSGITIAGRGFGNVTGLTVGVYLGVGNTGPTGLVATLVGPSAPPPSVSDLKYAPNAPVVLEANTTYWLVVSAPTTAPASGFSWSATDTTAEDLIPISGWSIGNSRWVTLTGGATWIFTPTGVLPQFAVEVNSIAPTITAQPGSQTAAVGSTVTLSVTTAGTAGPSFQWRKDGVAIPGATRSSLELSAVTKGTAGAYSVAISNSAGSVTSSVANLIVVPASALTNLSVRTAMVPGQVLILGGVVTGGTKTVLLRAAGPALASFNLAGMPDPRLELFGSGTVPIATNDDWLATLAPVFSSLAAFPFPVGSKDAALAHSLDGPFTVQASGTSGGIVLVEAYDAAGGTAVRLVNFSVRCVTRPGAGTLIAGITLSGTGTKQVLVRAVGPTLTQLFQTPALADPTLQVLDARGVEVGSNDNWSATLAPVFAQVGAFPLVANSRDAALLVNLTAGVSYTVQVGSAIGGEGEALVEVYEVF
jgi:hypothetical protein